MITILKGHRGNIDFSKPIEMNPEQRLSFITFMRNLFETIEEEEVKDLWRKRIGEKNFIRNWSTEEYILLISPDITNEEVSKRLGRSWMSIEMKRVFYIEEITKKANQKGINLYKADKETIKKLVEEYMQENNLLKLKRKKERKEKNIQEKREKDELKRLKEEIQKDKKLIGLIPGLTKEKLEEKEKRLKELEERFELNI
jgi:hypothetical protein